MDPQWAACRYATAVRERNVIGYLNDDATATVTGSVLPVEQAAAACAHVEELAWVVTRAGHRGRIGRLRADIYLGLLDGRWQHHTRDQIITDLLSRATSDPDHADQDPTARFAGALLRRHVEIRDRSCVYPGCRATTHSADLDHTIDHDHGGPTTTANSGPHSVHDQDWTPAGAGVDCMPLAPPQ